MKSNDISLRGAASVDNAKNDAAYSMSEIPNRAIIIIKESSKKKSVLSNFFVFYRDGASSIENILQLRHSIAS